MKYSMKPWPPFKLSPRQRIYIIPTWHGLIFLSLSIFCIIMGATYGSNLVHLLAFILLGIFLIAAIISNNYLKSVEVQRVDIQSNFFPQSSQVRFLIKNKSHEPRDGINIEISKKWKSLRVDPWSLDVQELKSVMGQLRVTARGKYQIDQIRISCTQPLGLFYVWAIIPLKAVFFAYPEPLGKSLPPEQVSLKKYQNEYYQTQSPEDFYQHRDYQEGESLGRVDWKALARGRAKMIKEFKSTGGRIWNLEWDSESLSDANLETKLSQYSLWLKTAQENKIRLSFRHPRWGLLDVQKPSDYTQCLSTLAMEGQESLK